MGKKGVKKDEIKAKCRGGGRWEEWGGGTEKKKKPLSKEVVTGSLELKMGKKKLINREREIFGRKSRISKEREKIRTTRQHKKGELLCMNSFSPFLLHFRHSFRWSNRGK